MRHTCQALQEVERTFTFIHDSLKLYKALIFKQRKVKAISSNCEVMKEIAHYRYSKISR
jgi:hypothetical protein